MTSPCGDISHRRWRGLSVVFTRIEESDAAHLIRTNKVIWGVEWVMGLVVNSLLLRH
jgi:hypothetical protein